MLNIELKSIMKTRVILGRQGYSLRQFSDKVGISQSYLSQILSKKRNPSPNVAYKIAEGLNMKVTDIFFIQYDNKSYHGEATN